MANFISLSEDQIPQPIVKPSVSQMTEIKPTVTDLTLYGGPPSSRAPFEVPTSCVQKPLSFKDWKQQQDSLMRAPPVSKQVRFNEPQSLPPLPPSTQRPIPTFSQPQSLPAVSNLLLKPPVCQFLEMSICDPSRIPPAQAPAVQQPALSDLLRKANFAVPVYRNQVANPPQTQCGCQKMVVEAPKIEPPATSSVDYEVKYQLSSMQHQFLSMQEQLALLQRQVEALLQNQTPKSPPKRDFSAQCSIHEKPPVTDAGVNTTHIDSDNTFFSQVLGKVNQILQQSDESPKIIETDCSSESISGVEVADTKKATDKSTFVNALAAKYLGKDMVAPRVNSNAASLDIDASKSCYNYMQKYDLLDARQRRS